MELLAEDVSGDQPTVVLLIEDNPGDALLIQLSLEQSSGTFPFAVEHVPRLSAGIERVARGGVDVILLDLHLPDSHGADTFLTLLDHAGAVPIVLLTSHVDEAMAFDAVRRGVQDYLIKGQIDAVRLLQAIRYAIARRRAEEALRRSEATTRALLDAIPDLILGVRCDGTITSISGSSRGILPDAPGSCVGQRIGDFAPPGVTGSVMSAIERALESGSLQVVEHTLPDGKCVRHLETRVVVHRSDEVLIIARDVTDQKTAEASLRRLNADLAERNADLDTFAHTVAHDLRHLLSPIVGYSELLYEEYAGQLSEELREDLKTIAQSGRSMSNLIDELLLLAGVRRQVVDMRPLDMQRIVLNALEKLSYLTKERGARIEVLDASRWPPALGYAPWIEEVWINYVSNALKYGGSPPLVRIGAEPEEAYVRFYVRDNGTGVPAGIREQLFQPIDNLGALNLRGHGLGLSIVRRIVQKCGGTVDVESCAGEGSTFSFTLPALHAPSEV